MIFSVSHFAGLLAILLLACVTPTLSHTWVEEIRLIASNGSFVGARGFPRGFGPRTAGVDPNAANVYQLPPNGRSTGTQILPTDLMCKASQTTQTQTSGYPRLVAAPNDKVALRFEENGHVTLFTTQDGKPEGRGTVFVYATTKSSPADTYLGIHRVWNQEGTGGDGRGKLIAAQPFDDGQCFQINGGAVSKARQAANEWPTTGGDLMCQNDIVIPADAGTSGLYTLYWVWEWPTLDRAGNVFKNESYTSCMDFELTTTPVSPAGKQVSFSSPLKGVALNSAAAPSQVNNAFAVDPLAPPKQAADNPFTEAGSAPVPVATVAPVKSSKSVSSTQATTPAGNPPAAVVTVTVTEQQHFTVTVTKEPQVTTAKVAPSASSNSALYGQTPAVSIPSPVASTLTKSTSASAPQTQQPSPSFSNISKPAGAYTADTYVPAVTPFLAPGNSVVQVAPRMVTIRGRAVNVMA